MEEQFYGYARVSSVGQNEECQCLALREFGISEQNIYVDKQSGKDFIRPNYMRMLSEVNPGDTVVVKSIDRLGRNYTDILEQWRLITKEKEAAIVVLDMPLLDTRMERDLTGTLISDMVLQLLSYVAETERDFIRSRQREGIEIAKAKGVHFGRKAFIRPPEFAVVYAEWERGAISARKAAQKLRVSHQTFLKWTKKSGHKGVL